MNTEHDEKVQSWAGFILWAWQMSERSDEALEAAVADAWRKAETLDSRQMAEAEGLGRRWIQEYTEGAMLS